MTPLLIAALRAMHVLAGCFWLGAVLVNAGFLLPAAQVTGSAGGPVVQQVFQVRCLPLFMNAAMLITLATGGILFWWASDGFALAWLSSTTGICWTVSSVLAVAAALLGHFINVPAARRCGRLADAAQSASQLDATTILAEMKRLQQRLLVTTRLAAVLLVLATAVMPAARTLQ
jgi:uncharacterized membrane protein